MAKNRIKKKNKSEPMVTESNSGDHASEAMDTSESIAHNSSLDGVLRKSKKGRPMKRSKNMRKKQAVAKAISQMEKSEVKVKKSESKTMRTVFAKNLYD